MLSPWGEFVKKRTGAAAETRWRVPAKISETPLGECLKGLYK
jgi:hypothetical protein